ncbi:MAG TPA: GNAT family protein [Candidatus Limnocylindria bacterium]|nr:GNAT family protein [Candidatus Limnocylindria bacterium]
MLGGIVRGRRVSLRPMRDDDLPGVSRWSADLRVRRAHSAGYWAEPATLATWKERLAEASKDHRSVLWAIESDGALVGSAAVGMPDPAFSDIVDVRHLTIDPERWRRGLGWDAALTVHRWIFDIAHVRIAATRVPADAAGALRIAERLGYTTFARGRRAYWHDGAHVDETRLRMELATWDERFGESERDYEALGPEAEA